MISVTVVFYALQMLIEPIFGYLYSERTIQVPVDHFSFSRNDSFQLKYLFNDSFWDGKSGPIFFYTGNEGAIEVFANNAGFVWEIAPKFKASIVFAEHRYYGRSLPFGDKSLEGIESAGYLTSQQALADYASLIDYLRSNQTEREKSPVIAFGGSYGGMLSAYLRIKYPHLVAGAIAASAPIWQFTGMTPCHAFYRIATGDFRAESNKCPILIKRSWSALRNITSHVEGLEWLTKEWKLCSNLTVKESEEFIDRLREMYVDLAMANYPYPADFLANLPGYPVRSFCQKLRNETAVGEDLLKELFRGISVYFNYTGKASCLDWKKGASLLGGDEAWSFQSCTEMVMPICSDGENDMFEKSPWDIKKYSDECWKKWKVRPIPNLIESVYGGKRIEDSSNIVFSNGLLDPWAGGGVIQSISDSLVSVIIPDGAHHLDLRGSDKADPGSVRRARMIHTKFIRKWIEEHNRKNK